MTLSKKVRKYIEKELLPLYQENDIAVSSQCRWHLNNDIYRIYEEHNHEDGPSKWVCQFCGKGFYEERFLNQHFRNRHPNHLQQGPDITCLADYCDIFRCDVMIKKHKPKYWDVALCKESELKKLKAKCDSLLPLCIQDISDPVLYKKLYNALHERFCGFLNCEKYWELIDKKMESLTTVFYVFSWMLVIIFIFIYYFIAITHYFTDDSLIDPQHRQLVPLKTKLKFFFGEGKCALKQKSYTIVLNLKNVSYISF